MDVLDRLFYSFAHELLPEQPTPTPRPGVDRVNFPLGPRAGDNSERLEFIVKVYAIFFSMFVVTIGIVVLIVRAPAVVAAAAVTGGAADWRRVFARVPRPPRQLRLALAKRARTAPLGAACRICQEGVLADAGSTPSVDCAGSVGCHEDQAGSGELACFCQCRGSLAFVHRGCLERWRALQKQDRCELCGSAYSLELEHATKGFCICSCGVADFIVSVRRYASSNWRPFRSIAFYGLCSCCLITAALVWLWLCSTEVCNGKESLHGDISSCALENSLYDWLGSICGSTAISVLVRFALVGTGVATRRPDSATSAPRAAPSTANHRDS